MTPEMEAILQVIDRYGLPLAMLGVLTVGVYKLIWPVLIRQIDTSSLQMKEQLKESNDRFDKASVEFLKALERRDSLMEKGFKDIHSSLSSLREHREPIKVNPKLRRPHE